MAFVKERKDFNNVNPDTLPPQSIEAEEAVLGAILKQPNVLNKVVEMLRPESFYMPAHRHIYEAIKHLYDSNENIDIVSENSPLFVRFPTNVEFIVPSPASAIKIVFNPSSQIKSFIKYVSSLSITRGQVIPPAPSITR